jgi:hypothetical protein
MPEKLASIVATERPGGQFIDISGGAGQLIEDLPPRSNWRKVELLRAAESLGWQLANELPGGAPDDEVLWFRLSI